MRQLQPPCPAGLLVLSRLGLEPGYRLAVQGNRYPLDETGLQGLLLPQRPLVGLREEFQRGPGHWPILVDPLVCVGILGQLDSNLYLLRYRPYEAKTFTGASKATRIAAA